jgi:23S rRNA pseudouridine2605 synthase/16S rRNA pseudouridine516 synthase
MKERLQKVLAGAGVASRRKAEELIAHGQVMVNGRVAALGDTVDPAADRIEVNGRSVSVGGGRVYLALNKPTGYISTVRADRGEPTVLDLVIRPERVYPVGRLDKDTSGLLLLTNDGDWAHLLTHPRYAIEKEYEVLVTGQPTAATLRRLSSGVELSDGSKTSPATVRRISQRGRNTLLSLTLREGKKRQIRQMCQAVGHPVLQLRRVRVGPIQLATLGVGAWRHLQPKEVESVREHARRSAKGSA